MTTSITDVYPVGTAGALPSSRTEALLNDALNSNDINAVKLELIHTWAHYQSLEFVLNAAATDPKVIRDSAMHLIFASGLDLNALTQGDLLDLVTRIYARGVLEKGYKTAHESLSLITSHNVSVSDALRMLYSALNHADPEVELTDEELSRFFTE